MLRPFLHPRTRSGSSALLKLWSVFRSGTILPVMIATRCPWSGLAPEAMLLDSYLSEWPLLTPAVKLSSRPNCTQGPCLSLLPLMQLWSRLMSVGRVTIGGMGDVIPVAWALEKWSRPSLATSAGELFHLQGKLAFQWFEYWREGHNLHGPGRTAPYPTTLPPHQPHFYALTICNG